jgi:hypothetical protein
LSVHHKCRLAVCISHVNGVGNHSSFVLTIGRRTATVSSVEGEPRGVKGE